MNWAPLASYVDIGRRGAEAQRTYLSTQAPPHLVALQDQGLENWKERARDLGLDLTDEKVVHAVIAGMDLLMRQVGAQHDRLGFPVISGHSWRIAVNTVLAFVVDHGSVP